MENFDLVLSEVRTVLNTGYSISIEDEYSYFRVYDSDDIIPQGLIDSVVRLGNIEFLSVSLDKNKNKIFALFKVID